MVLGMIQYIGTRMASHIVKVRRGPLVACLTCPLCNNLFREATTICECLHTFCRECIYEKLNDGEADCCPICNIDLGCVPVEKLRPDHNLQDVRARIFPLEKRRMKPSENIAPVSLPVRRKERSLSSLVISTPRISTQTGLTGRRTKAVARKAAALRGSGFVNEDIMKREIDVAQDYSERSSSPEPLRKSVIPSRRQVFAQHNSGGEPSNHMADDDTCNISSQQVAGQRIGKTGSWKPLNCLAEAANRTKTFQSRLLGLSSVKTEDPENSGSEEHMNDMKLRDSRNNSISQVESKGNIYPGPSSRKVRRLNGTGRERVSTSRNLGGAAGNLLNASCIKRGRRINPVWFALLAAENQDGDGALPQIPTCYLRIKDGNIPVSFVKKYLVKKLDLKSESEVEITCCGQPVVPSLPLHSLIDFWLHTAASDRLNSVRDTESQRNDSKKAIGTANASAAEFMMVLTYGRKPARS